VSNYPVLTTERLLLRMLEERDFDEYAAIHMDPEVTKFTARAHLDRQESWRHMAMIVGHWHLRGYGFFGVFERDTERLVGRVGFWHPATWPDFELGGRWVALRGAKATRPKRRVPASTMRSRC
jgi:RimJ/RimL family protein N-acetyltransferase